MSKIYGIGGTEVKRDENEAISDIPQNRTVFIEKLTNETPVKPVIAKGLKTVEEVFEHYKPNVTVDFEGVDGMTKKEELKFNHLGDFGATGITNQSKFLKELKTEKDQYVKIIKQLKTNKILKAALTDPEAKAALLESISALVSEIDKTK